MAKSIFLSLLVILVFPLVTISAEANSIPGLDHNILDNGMEIFILENHAVPLVTIQITFRCGSITQSDNTTGLFHLYEHMLFKGNEVYPEQSDFKAAMKELGVGSWNGGTSTEYVTYYFTIPSAKLDRGIDFWANAVRYSLLEENELEIEKDVVINEIRGYLNDPDEIYQSAVKKKLFYKYPWRRDVGGVEATIAGATTAQMQDIKDNYYVPDNCALFIAGDVDPETVMESVYKSFGDWVPAEIKATDVPPHPLMDSDEKIIYPDPKMYPDFAFIQMSMRGPDVLDDPEATYAADVWLKLLDDPTGKFKENIFNKVSGLYHKDYIFASYYTQKDGGQIVFGTYMLVDSEKSTLERTEEFKQAVLDEISLMAEDSEYFSEKNFGILKNILEDETIIEIESPISFISTLSFWWASASTGYYYGYVPNMKKVTHSEISDYLNRYVISKPSVLSVRMNPENFTLEEPDSYNFEVVTRENAFWWKGE